MKFTSPVYSAVSGSISGLTYSHNRGGMYARARAIPTNPSTDLQVAVRATLAGLAAEWGSDLTQVERDAWKVYADNVPLTDTLGNPLTLTGQQMFIRTNTVALQIGLPRIDAAPTVYDLGGGTAPTIASVTAATDIASLAFQNGDGWANETYGAMVVYTSAPKGAAINYFKGPYRYTDLIEGNDTTPPTSPAAITLLHDFAVDNKLFSYVRLLRADGRLSTKLFIGGVLAT